MTPCTSSGPQDTKLRLVKEVVIVKATSMPMVCNSTPETIETIVELDCHELGSRRRDVLYVELEVVVRSDKFRRTASFAARLTYKF